MWFEVTEALQDLFVRYHQETTHNANPSSMEPWMLKIPKVESRDKTARAIVETYLTSMRMVSMLLKHMPAYAWLVSYSLLISGCVQRNADVEELIGKIILKVLQHHPQQAIWHIFPLANSTSEERKQKYHWIRKQTASHGVKGTELSLTQFFDDAAAFATQISALCAHKPPKEKGSTSVEVKLSDMCQMEQRIPKELIMPSEQQLSFLQFLDISKDPKNPFANKPVYIRRAHPKVEILRSLAKPRKLILYGSDELEYWFLCKPVDDLRKDARMMEFSAMVNRLLKKDLETRKRELRIRTYAVLPLSDGSGILSWVRATNGLRGIINDTYAMDGLDLTEKIKEIRHWFEKGQAEAGDWEQQFVEKLLPRFPLALSKWFLLNFTEPSKWLRARTNFARTCGVMSVIGTILGLGDRHCENILIDSENGDCLHVDLNCLFFKGKTFLIPEVVPFRLTRNMVDAFGVMGFEGVFRKACEHTMQIMRQNKDALMSVLGTFVHDPLLEWNDGISPPIATRHQKTITSAMDAANTHYSHERYNRMAVDILNGIADRLDGMMRNPDNMDQIIVPLSVQGYVDAVIREATSPANLCKMYVGWSSFL
jgi:serine/threonine-protein kinase ATR